MYTQCPECQTVFRLTEEQLALAGGKVRCGHCLGVFTAREHEVDAVPQPRKPRPTPPGQTAAGPAVGGQGRVKPRQEGGARPRPDSGMPKSGAGSPAKKPVSHAQMEREIERILSEEPGPEAGPRAQSPSVSGGRTGASKTPEAPKRQPENPAPAARPAGRSPSTSPPARAGTPPRGRSSQQPAGAARKSPPREAGPHGPVASGPGPGKRPGAASAGSGREAPPETAPVDRHDPDQAARDVGTSQPGQTPAAPDSGSSPSGPDQKGAPIASPADPVAERDESPHFSATEDQAPEDEALPAALRQPERSGSGPIAVVFWSLASLLMLALLVAQYGYYERYDLAKNPTYRPWLERMCVYLDCRLPPRRDTAAFELQERDVRYHPEYAGALLISGTFINRAAFAQPYPTVEVLLRDVNGDVVAGRRFSPAEYMQGGPKAALLEPGTEAQLLLEVSDPGNQAVSFEFNFF